MEIIITSLKEHLDNPNSERYQLIQKNKQLYPQIKTIESINGYNSEDVLIALRNSNIKFFNVSFKTLGTLACFLTKIMIWKKQIEEEIPYLCLLEDDLELNKYFLPFIEAFKHELNNENINLLRLADWGECYVTSLESAKRLVALFEKKGIWRNVDEQLWECGEKVVNHSRGHGHFGVHKENTWKNGYWEHVGYVHDIFKLHKETNKGDILKTHSIPYEISETLCLGNRYDMQPDQISTILEETHDNKNFLSFSLNGMCWYLLKQLNSNQSLTSYEYGNSIARLNMSKNKLKISNEKFNLKDLCFYDNKIDWKLHDDLNRTYGKKTEENNPKVILHHYLNIDYKKYDVFIINGFARAALIYMILKKANKGSKIFLNNASRHWYDWSLNHENIKYLDSLDLKLITV